MIITRAESGVRKRNENESVVNIAIANQSLLRLPPQCFDRDSNVLTTSSERVYTRKRSGKVLMYHFFVKERTGARYLVSKRVSDDFGIMTSMNVEFEGLGIPSSYRNLYLIQEYSHNGKTMGRNPRFDAAKAVPILLKSR